MTNKMTQDFYMMHYVYYWNDGTQRGEGNLYLATPTGTGVRKVNIDEAIDHVVVGLQNNLGTGVVVVPTAISYLTSCSSEDFHYSPNAL